jgi:hypothetical protein
MHTIKIFGIAGALMLAACSSTGTTTDQAAVRAAAAKAPAQQAICQAGTPDPRACDPSETQKTTICHIPPGNPDNAHTLCVGTPAVDAHLAHGDFLGSCCPAGTDDGGTTPPDDGGTTPPGNPTSPPPSSPPPSDPAPTPTNPPIS